MKSNARDTAGETDNWLSWLGVVITGDRRKRLSLAFLVFCNVVFMVFFASFSTPQTGDLSPFEQAVNGSSTLQIFIAGVIFSSLPVMIEFILDQTGRKVKGSQEEELTNRDIIERFSILLAFIVPNSLYFILRLTLEGTEHLPLVYLSLSLSQNLVLFVSVYSTIIALCPSVVSFKYILAATIFQVVGNISQLIWFENPGQVVYGITVFAETLQYSLMALILYSWIQSLRLRSRAVGESSSFEITYDEQTCSIYLLFISLSTVVRIVTSIHFKSLSWHTTGEGTLVAYAVAQVLFCIPLTILPGRIAKEKAVNILRLNREVKRSYLRYISHEVRSPLNVSHAGLEILAAEINKMKASETIKELVRDVYDANDTAVKILDDMLQFENMDQGAFTLDLKKRHIKALFVRKWRSMMKAVETRNIHVNLQDMLNVSGQSVLHRSYHGNAPLDNQQEDEESGLTASCILDMFHLVVFIDSDRIIQVIRNLLLNAVKYTMQGQTIGILVSARKEITEVTVKVPTTVNSKEIVNKAVTRRAEGFLRFEVSDTGTGSAADNRSLIFREHAFSQHDLRGGGGTSLGLMISRTIISMHGGRMDCIMSPVTRENIFYFELPLFNPDTHLNKEFIGTSEEEVECSLNSNRSSLSNKASVSSGRSVLSSLKDALNGNSHRSSIGLSSLEILDDTEKRKDMSDDGTTEDSNGNTGRNTSDFKLKLDISRESTVRLSRSTNLSNEFNNDSNDLRKSGSCDDLQFKATTRRRLTSQKVREQRKVRNDDDIPFTEDWTPHASGNDKVKTFLIVDDSPTSLKILHRMISCERELLPIVDFLFADDGTSAVEVVRDLMKSGPIPDCIFMDFTMINMHGPEAARIIRKLGYNGPILGVTGNVMTEDVQTFMDGGATEVLCKPLSRVKLLRALKGNSIITKDS